MTELENDPHIEFLTKVHDLAAESQELEELLIEALATVSVMHDEDPTNPVLIAAKEFNERLLNTLMSQRVILGELTEYSLKQEDWQQLVKTALMQAASKK